MAVGPEGTVTDLRIPLLHLLSEMEATLENVRRPNKALTGHDLALEFAMTYIGQPLRAETERVEPSGAAVENLARLALAVVARTDMPEKGTGSGPYQKLNNARKQLQKALTTAELTDGEEAAKLQRELLVTVQNLPATVAEKVIATLHETYTAEDLEESTTGPPHPSPSTTTAASDTEDGDEDLDDEEDEDRDELITLLRKFPHTMTRALLASVPDVVSAVQMALASYRPPTIPNPVPDPVEFDNLQELAAASAGDYTESTTDQINFLAGALDVLTSSGPVPAQLIPPITNVVWNVLTYVNPQAPPGFAELSQLNSIKQQIAPILQQPTAVIGR